VEESQEEATAPAMETTQLEESPLNENSESMD